MITWSCRLSMMSELPIANVRAYSDGTSYRGASINGLRHGHGKQTFVDGSVYIGNFVNGLADGMGLLKFVNGSEYCGYFEKGKFNGIGRFVLPSGNVVEGEFCDGKLEGRGVYKTHSNSTQKQGIFANGKFLKEEACEDLVHDVNKTTLDVQEYIVEIKKSLSTM